MVLGEDSTKCFESKVRSTNRFVTLAISRFFMKIKSTHTKIVMITTKIGFWFFKKMVSKDWELDVEVFGHVKGGGEQEIKSSKGTKLKECKNLKTDLRLSLGMKSFYNQSFS